jgi:hypothetical protein
VITDRGVEVAQLFAAAVDLGDELGRFYCRDPRLSAAAATLGFDVRQPA